MLKTLQMAVPSSPMFAGRGSISVGLVVMKVADLGRATSGTWKAEGAGPFLLFCAGPFGSSGLLSLFCVFVSFGPAACCWFRRLLLVIRPPHKGFFPLINLIWVSSKRLVANTSGQVATLERKVVFQNTPASFQLLIGRVVQLEIVHETEAGTAAVLGASSNRPVLQSQGWTPLGIPGPKRSKRT